MNNKNFKNILLVFLISIFLLIFNIFVNKNGFVYAESIMAAFLMVIVFVSILLFGFQKDKKNHLKNNIFIKVAQVLTLYFIVIYLSGLYFGFSKIVFSLKPLSIINNTLAPFLIFICLELFRYVLIKCNVDNKKNIVLFICLIFILELSVSTRYLFFNSFESAFKLFADFIIPIAMKQVMLSYICYYGGLKSNILYRIVNVLYTYVIPIHPAFSDTMLCMINILLPLILLFKVKKKRKK